jgi:hypothetical protein
MTTITMPKTKTLVVEEPLTLHTYATKCWQGVRLSDIFRLKLDRERNDWHQYIGRFNGSSDAFDK